ncbi:alpha/beta hydrolase [Dactylosporangium sp. NPDC000244]|uniref:alpha/beta hydrolase n=1 Tax=Dactylosporangium sp. NPDC000244 TaxID=3154365 RepID=UPI0033180E42
MTIFADEAVERFVLGLRAPGPKPSVARMREGAAQRARERPPGPPMAVEDRVAGHVPVRVYPQEGRTRIVYLHGGGFVLGDLDTHDLVCRRLAAATGATVVAVGYRRAPEHAYPAAVEDALAVLGWAAEAGPVAVAGDSAGAFVAVLAARRAAVPLVAQLLVCPLLDLALTQPSADEFGLGYTLDVPELREWISWWAPEPQALPNPLRFPLEGMPPALIVAAGLDPLRDGAVAYAERLRGAGVPATLHVEAGLVHNHPMYAHLAPAAERAYARFLTDAAAILR